MNAANAATGPSVEGDVCLSREGLAEFMDSALSEVGLHGRLNASQPTGHASGDVIAPLGLPHIPGVNPNPSTVMMLALADVLGRSAADVRRCVQRLAAVLEHLEEPRDSSHHFDVEPAAVAEQTAVTLLALSELDPGVYARYVSGEGHVSEPIEVLDSVFAEQHGWVLERMVVMLMTATRGGVQPLRDPELIPRVETSGWRARLDAWNRKRRRTPLYYDLLDGRAAEIAPFSLCFAWTDGLPEGASSPRIEDLAALLDTA